MSLSEWMFASVQTFDRFPGLLRCGYCQRPKRSHVAEDPQGLRSQTAILGRAEARLATIQDLTRWPGALHVLRTRPKPADLIRVSNRPKFELVENYSTVKSIVLAVSPALWRGDRVSATVVPRVIIVLPRSWRSDVGWGGTCAGWIFATPLRSSGPMRHDCSGSSRIVSGAGAPSRRRTDGVRRS